MRAVTERRQLAQTFLPGLAPTTPAIETLASANTEDRGAVFTRREVVDFILDLVEYVSSSALYKASLLEPSFGHGDFLIPAIQRLLSSVKNKGLIPNVDLLKNSIRAVELHHGSFEKTKNAIGEILLENGLTQIEARTLLDAWLVRGDFLLTQFEQSFTHVVGNPPYIRQEMIPVALMEEYRRRYETIYDRADIYVPFIEYSLKLLDQGGVLGFICADRWMKKDR